MGNLTSVDTPAELDDLLEYTIDVKGRKTAAQIEQGVNDAISAKATADATTSKVNSFIEEFGSPTGFTLPTEFAGLKAQKVGDQYSCNLTAQDFIDFENDFTRYMYVDADMPDNNGDGLSWATAKRAIGEAVDDALSNGISSIILVKSGLYPRYKSFSNVSAKKTLTCNIALMAVGGRVEMGPFEELTWTKNTTFPNVSEVARNSAQQILNTEIRSWNGKHKRYKHVSSLLECSQNQGTWFTDNTNCYVNTHSGALANDQNARLILHSRNVSITGAFKFYMYGIDCIGGTTSPIDSIYATVALDDCTAKYAASGTQANGLSEVDGIKIKGGMLAAFNCEASFGSKDGFNFNSYNGDIAKILTVNCKGFQNGYIIDGVQSCNGWTAHTEAITIDIGGEYLGSAGANVAIVHNGTHAWCFGTKSGSSGGDYVGISTGGFSIGDEATMWLENTTDVATKVGLNAGDGAMYTRNHKGSGERVGTITALVR